MFKKGVITNPKGRPKGPAETKKLVEILRQYEIDNHKDFARHYLALAFKHKDIAKDLAGRIWPQLKAEEVSVAGGALNLLIKIEKTYGDNV